MPLRYRKPKRGNPSIDLIPNVSIKPSEMKIEGKCECTYFTNQFRRSIIISTETSALLFLGEGFLSHVLLCHLRIARTLYGHSTLIITNRFIANSAQSNRKGRRLTREQTNDMHCDGVVNGSVVTKRLKR